MFFPLVLVLVSDDVGKVERNKKKTSKPEGLRCLMFFKLIWDCDVPTRCTRTDELLSWVIRAPSAQHAVVNGRSHWNFGQLPSILTMPQHRLLNSWPPFDIVD